MRQVRQLKRRIHFQLFIFTQQPKNQLVKRYFLTYLVIWKAFKESCQNNKCSTSENFKLLKLLQSQFIESHIDHHYRVPSNSSIIVPFDLQETGQRCISITIGWTYIFHRHIILSSLKRFCLLKILGSLFWFTLDSEETFHWIKKLFCLMKFSLLSACMCQKLLWSILEVRNSILVHFKTNLSSKLWKWTKSLFATWYSFLFVLQEWQCLKWSLIPEIIVSMFHKC